jgi:cobalt-zinc-cadmium efflux system outer membrane protein
MLKTLFLRLCAALVACAFVAAKADPVPPSIPDLTLGAARAKVMQSSPALQALAHEILARDGLIRQAGAIPNPEISGLVEDHQSTTRTTTIQLTQSIETGGKRGARIDAAQRDRDLAQADLLAKRAGLYADTSAGFHALLAAQAQIELAQTTLELARRGLAAATSRVAAGKNSPVDETRARIATSGAEIELAQAQGELENAREVLAALWGGSGSDIGRATGNLEQLPEAAPLSMLVNRLQQAPGIVQARIELARRVSLGRVEMARRSPDLAVTVGSKKDQQLGRRQAVFGVSVPLPLFDRNQGGIQESQQRTEIARGELAAVHAALASKLRLAHSRLTVARSQAGGLERDQLPGAQSTYEATRKGYEYGKFTILDVFDAQRVYLHAKAQHLRVLTTAHAAAADIDRILGAPGVDQP